MKKILLLLILSFSVFFANAQNVAGDELRIYKNAQIGEDGNATINMHSNRVQGVADPISLLDAVNLQYFTNNMSLTQPLDSLSLTPLTENDIETEYTMFADTLSYSGSFNTALGGFVYKLGQSTLLLYYNDNAYAINTFDVLHLKGGALVDGQLYPTPELADASDWEKTQGTLSVAAHPIPPNSFGFTVLYGVIKGGSTLGLTAGEQMWLSDDGTGDLTTTRPMFQSYAISIGGVFNSVAAPDGQIFVNITRDIYDTFNDGWDGAIRETFNFTTSSDGATITGSLENVVDTKNLTLIFSDGFSTFETTPAATVSLVAGTATTIQLNYVFIDKATKTLQSSTGGFPITEHAKISVVGLLDAATTQSNGALRNQNINDHIKKEDDNGHILHIAERLRQFNAEWDSGAETTLSGTPSNLWFANTSGKVYQLHIQDFPAQDMNTGSDIHVVNDPTTAYRTTTNLNDITEFSDGSSWNNEWSNLVVWGVCNKSGEVSHLMVNLPSDGYTSESDAFNDNENFTNYTIPKDFRGVGFLLGRFTIRRSGANFTYNLSTGYLDLRGFIPNNTAGTGGGGPSGITTFPALTDTPSSYSGFGGQAATVTALEDGLEFTPVVTKINGDSPTLGNYDIIMTANKVGENVTVGTGGTGVDAVFSVADNDNVIGNELQNLTNSKLNNDITINISDGSGTTISNIARTDFNNEFQARQSYLSGVDNGATSNTWFGYFALNTSRLTQLSNTAFGRSALRNISSGANNSAFGTDAGNSLIGGGTPSNFSSSTYIGSSTKVSLNGVVNENVFGYLSEGKGSNTVSVGNSSITNNYFNGALDLNANEFIQWGGTDDVAIYGDNQDDLIFVGRGLEKFRTTDATVSFAVNVTGSGYGNFNTIRTNAVERIDASGNIINAGSGTFGDNVTINGDIDLTGGQQVIKSDGVNQIVVGSDNVSIRYAGAEKLKTTTSGIDITGGGNFSETIESTGGDVVVFDDIKLNRNNNSRLVGKTASNADVFMAYMGTDDNLYIGSSATIGDSRIHGGGNLTLKVLSTGVDVDGDISCVDLNYSGSLNPTSDKRVKNDIKPLEFNKETYLLLNPISSYYNYDSTKTIHGSFLAQELESLYPNLVKHSNSKVVIDRKIVDINSLDSIAQLNIKDEDRLRTIDPMSIIPLNTLATQKALIKCDSLQLIVDENKLQIEILKTLIKNLDGRLKTLEN